MTGDFDRPPDRRTGSPQPAAAGGSTFPRDETRDRPATEHPLAPGGTAPVGGGVPQAVDPGLADQEPESPVDHHQEPPSNRFRERWASVQGAFVDDPKAAVVEADRLVAEVIYDLEQKLTRRRESMQGAWKEGEPDTEQLRQHLHGYRALFHRLLETGF